MQCVIIVIFIVHDFTLLFIMFDCYYVLCYLDTLWNSVLAIVILFLFPLSFVRIIKENILSEYTWFVVNDISNVAWAHFFVDDLIFMSCLSFSLFLTLFANQILSLLHSPHHFIRPPSTCCYTERVDIVFPLTFFFIHNKLV